MKKDYSPQCQATLALTLIALVVISFVSACGPQTYQPPLPSPPSPPQVWLDWPLDGAYPPTQIEVLAHAHDPSGRGVDKIELWVNGELVTTTQIEGEPYFAQALQAWPPNGPPEPKDYFIEVRAINKNGQSSEPAGARIIIVESQPRIITFTADKTTLKLPECTTLRWSVENAQEVKLNDESVPSVGDHATCPRQPNNTYRLSAIPRTGESVDQSITVVVLPTAKPPPGIEVSFEYDDSSYQKFGDCITLFWVVRNAQTVQLDKIDEIKNVGLQGSEQVCPTAAQNVYRLIVVSLTNETFEPSLTFIVPPPPTPTATPTATPISTSTSTATPTNTPTPTITPTPITPTPPKPAQVSCSVDNSDVRYGQCTIIHWTIVNVQAAYLNREGITGPQGSKRVCPESTTNYVLTAHLIDGGTQTCNVRITVHGGGDYYYYGID